ncbi:MAG: hypothetical protein HYV07_10910 [Deltaproteobacteria bacterium]|nr:hypothetical protein [Deltaproteobacteria bacterium]
MTRPVWATQALASLRLSWWQGVRAPFDVKGARRGSRPLLTLAVTETLLGSFFAMSMTRDLTVELVALRAAAIQGILAATFLAALVQAALILVPDSLDNRRRTVELVAVKPMGPRAQLLNQLMSTLVVTTTMVTFFSVPVLGVLGFRHGLSMGSISASMIWLWAAGWSGSLAWQLLTHALGRRFGFDAVRGAAIGALMVGMGSSLFLVPLFARHFVDASEWQLWFPTVWLARAVFFEPRALVLSMSLVTLPVVVAFSMTNDLAKWSMNEALVMPKPTRPAAPAGARLLSWMGEMGPIRRWFGVETLAVARLVSLCTQREPLHAISVWPWRLMLLVNLAIAAWSSMEVARTGLAVASSLLLVEGFRTTQHSSSAAAIITIEAAPIDVPRLLTGQWLAILVSDYWPAIFAIVVVSSWGSWGSGLMTTLVLLVESRVVVAVLAGIGRTLPLSRDAQTKAQLPSFLFGLAFSVIGVLRDQLLQLPIIWLVVYLVSMSAVWPFADRWAKRRARPLFG